MFLAKLASAPARIFARSKQTPVAALLAEPASSDLRELARRTVARDMIDFRTAVTVEALGQLDARLMDISPYGFQCRASSRMLERGERAWVVLPLVGEQQADVMWGLKGLFGCRFVEPIDPDLYARLLDLIRSGEPEGAPSAA